MSAHAGMQHLYLRTCVMQPFCHNPYIIVWIYAGFLAKKNLWNTNIQAMMVATGGNVGAKPVVFMGHSMGGAVVCVI